MWDNVVRPIRDHLPLWLLLLPMWGAVLVAFTRSFGPAASRRTMLVNLWLSAALCVWMVVAYEPLKPASSIQQAAQTGPLEQFQFRDSFAWVGETRTTLIERTGRDGAQRTVEVPIRWGPDICLDVGVDGISIWFVALSVLLVGVGVSSEVGSRKSEIAGVSVPDSDFRIPTPSAAWLWLQASLVGTFVALDVVLIAACWMSTLLAIAWLIGQGEDLQRREAGLRWFKRGWVGVWLIVLGLGGLVLALSWLRASPNRPETPLIFATPELVAGISREAIAGEDALRWASINNWLFWLLVLGFTGPLWLAPFHRGFVEAFAAAPRGVAVVLAGVALKVGVYGWLRFLLPLFADQLRQHSESITALLGLSGLLAAALAFGATNWWNRIALATCSSVSLSLLGLATLTLEGLTGGFLRLLSHGLTAGLLVWLLPRKAKHLPSNSQIATSNSPLLSPRWRVGLLRFALFAWIGLPGLSGFWAEFITPFGLFQHELNVAAISLATSGVIAWMWVRAERDCPDWSQSTWSRREMIVAAVLVVLNIGLGFAPQFVVDRVQPSLLSLLPVDRDTSATSSGTAPAAEVR